ncbi:hypothetical protein BJX61DRAFT_259248 [Aspergillus egyptiacus]|nr:hypothetical protein BJX61DRAFT_259248 [Aspergillus egyptiacus]
MAADTIVPVKTDQANGSDSTTRGFNPYETDAALIPEDDPFRQRSTHYGRYKPRDDDFSPRYNDWCQYSPDAIKYWEETVQTLWTPENCLNLRGTRQAYAAGSIIIRVDQEDMAGVTDKFSCLNANELSASRKAEDTLGELGVAVPKIYFCGTISGKNITVESRIPGVSLDTAWRYLTSEQIEILKQQCRRILQRLGNVDTGPGHPSYVCSGLNSHLSSEAEKLERDILFRDNEQQDDLSFVHNNMLLSNVIVNDDRVVGLAGWREAGYFGFEKADKLHRQIRFSQILSEPELGAGVDNIETWVDLYEGLVGAAVNRSAGEQSAAPAVKTEPSSTDLDKVPLSDEHDIKPVLPQLDGTDISGEHPTPRKVANLKNQGNSRASSADRSSPAPSTKTAAKRTASGGSKKGIGKKASTKNQKVDEQDNESVTSRRSNTPVSSRTSKAPGTKKRNSASVASSPAPEPKKKRGPKRGPKKGAKKGVKKAVVQEDESQEEEEGSDDEEYCICRKPDNHTWMIGCDGGCEDWFHGKCVNIDQRDEELIDKYICPNCEQNGKGRTTWKPMCRLKDCRKPVRFNQKNPSKYCSDEHGLEFMRQKTQHLNLSQPRVQKPIPIRRAALSGTRTPRDDGSEYEGSHIEDEKDDSMEDLGSRGGILTVGDLTAVVMGVSSAEEFRKLGAHIVSPPPEDKDANEETKASKKLGLDVGVEGLTYSPDEAEKIEKLRKRRDELFHRQDMLAARNNFLTLVRQRSKSILEVLKKKDPKGGWKDICGFDTRLAWSDEEFDEWRLSDIGKNALQEGTPEALASSYPEAIDADGDAAMDGVKAEDDVTSLARGVCLKKRCERHKQWLKVQQQDAAFEEGTVKQDLADCEEEAQGVVERAVLRMWAEKENAQNGC